MSQQIEYPTEYIDQTDLAFEPAYDIDLIDDPTDSDFGEQLLNESAWRKLEPRKETAWRKAERRKESAWRKIERRKESAWLRDQMVDWDDWND